MLKNVAVIISSRPNDGKLVIAIEFLIFDVYFGYKHD